AHCKCQRRAPERGLLRKGRPVSGPIVVDVGNTRVKWGLCSSAQVWSIAPLPADDAEAWSNQWHEWKLQRPQEWIVSGVHPQRRDELVTWLERRSDAVHVLTWYKQLPIKVELEHPEKGASIDCVKPGPPIYGGRKMSRRSS